ncbi:hypothetical protein Ciccas_008701 [Cichlidogyrus casuarinus]|uniref:Uncharacterized protein n=1 Tax=Cichlidogyrus casuarinus TaxID=1844966 RepID=A0ABD2PZ55_9PLAT
MWDLGELRYLEVSPKDTEAQLIKMTAHWPCPQTRDAMTHIAFDSMDEGTRQGLLYRSPVSWFRVQRVCCLKPASLPTKREILSSEFPTDSLVWFVAGEDGYVNASQVTLTNGKKVERKLHEADWFMTLKCHASCITDADIDPSGQFLVTVSLDRIAKVHGLYTKTTVMITEKVPDLLRCVSFRPLIHDQTKEQYWHFATGGDEGIMRCYELNNES